MNTNDLNYPMMLERQLGKRANNFINAPTDFSSANNMFSSAMKNPSFMLGPGGSFIDPSQQQSTASTNYLNDRSNIAATNLSDKDQMAQLLLSLGSNIGNQYATQQGLNASLIGSQGGLFGGGIGGLFGGL